jgi:hypothetical protein
MTPIEDANTRKVNRYLARLLAKLRQMEREKRSGELILRVGVASGGVNRWQVETSEGGRADDE